MKTVAGENFDNEVVRGNKGGSDHRPNLRCINMVWTKPYEDGPIVFDNEVMDYLAYAEETSDNNYHHYQGFVCWKSARWTYACKKKYKCFFDKMVGTLIQNDDYCSKQGMLKEFGRVPKQGERTDLSKLINSIQERSVTVNQIVLEQPMMYHQYGRTLEKAEDITLRSVFRTEMTTCDWYVGKTAKGKSRAAFKEYSPKTHYTYPYDNGWWDGYVGQDTVILDEYRGQLQYSEILRLIDRYPVYVRRRGREPMPFTSKHIIITSSLTPEEVYHNLSINDSLDQLTRRIKLIRL